VDGSRRATASPNGRGRPETKDDNGVIERKADDRRPPVDWVWVEVWQWFAPLRWEGFAFAGGLQCTAQPVLADSPVSGVSAFCSVLLVLPVSASLGGLCSRAKVEGSILILPGSAKRTGLCAPRHRPWPPLAGALWRCLLTRAGPCLSRPMCGAVVRNGGYCCQSYAVSEDVKV
jgi:hypothetical protein